MKSLVCNPNIFIVNNEYHIVVLTKSQGVVCIQIGNKCFYEYNSGFLPVHNKVHKIIFKQEYLNKALSYKVIFKKLIKKESYKIEFEKIEEYIYTFNYNQSYDLSILYLADIHSYYKEAIKISNNIKKIDLLIFNGDFGECKAIKDFISLSKMLSTIMGGKVPIIWGRGNHDTRGDLAEYLDEYIGMDNQKAYFKFQYGKVEGAVLDCGEDKNDNHFVYSGINIFEEYRKKQELFLKNLRFKENSLKFVVSHISFMLKESMYDEFDVYRDIYKKWADELNKKNIEFMITGHTHDNGFFPPSSLDKQIHNYLVVSGSKLDSWKNILEGTIINTSKEKIEFKFINNLGEITNKYILNRDSHE